MAGSHGAKNGQGLEGRPCPCCGDRRLVEYYHVENPFVYIPLFRRHAPFQCVCGTIGMAVGALPADVVDPPDPATFLSMLLRAYPSATPLPGRFIVRARSLWELRGLCGKAPEDLSHPGEGCAESHKRCQVKERALCPQPEQRLCQSEKGHDRNLVVGDKAF
jgi:hypothetical protein